MEEEKNISGIKTFLAYPEKYDKAVILVHEIWGLNDNIKDVARRIANEGYMGFAPHLYSGYDELVPENIERVMYKVWNSIDPSRRNDFNAYKQLRDSMNETEKKVLDLLVLNRQNMEEIMLKRLIDLYNYLNSQGIKKIVSMGFCMGGGLAFQLGTEVPLNGIVNFYGRNPQPIDKVQNVKGPILGIYAGEDPPIISGLPELVSAIIKYKKDFEVKIYPGAYHAFFNDRGKSYNKEAAEDAWERVIRFLKRV